MSGTSIDILSKNMPAFYNYSEFEEKSWSIKI